MLRRRGRPGLGWRFNITYSLPRVLQEAHLGEAQVVEAPADGYGLHGRRTCTRMAPGTGSPETTHRYPPPQPEYMAPG